MPKSSYQKLAALALLAALAFTPVASTQQALAYDDDVDFVCGENDDGTDWCVSVDELKAECPLSDPDGVGDECAGLETSIGGNRGPNKFDFRKPVNAARHLAIINATPMGGENEVSSTTNQKIDE